MAHDIEDIEHRIRVAARRIMCGEMKLDHIKAEYRNRVAATIRAFDKTDREGEEWR